MSCCPPWARPLSKQRGHRSSSSAPCCAGDDTQGLQEGWKLDPVHNRIIPEVVGAEPSYNCVYTSNHGGRRKLPHKKTKPTTKPYRRMWREDCIFNSLQCLAKVRWCIWHLVCKEILAWMKKYISNFNVQSQVINTQAVRVKSGCQLP